MSRLHNDQAVKHCTATHWRAARTRQHHDASDDVACVN